MPDITESALVGRLAGRHGLSSEAVRTVLEALRRSGGSMAQFSHPDFGGMSQWSPGMTMVGDMFNDGLKAKLDAVATELAAHVRTKPEVPKREADVSYASRSQGNERDWPAEFGRPSSTGAQNHLSYAVFPDSRRLIIDDAGKRTVYDTGSHVISGISQAQSGSSTLTFRSQDGLVRLEDLKRVD